MLSNKKELERIPLHKSLRSMMNRRFLTQTQAHRKPEGHPNNASNEAGMNECRSGREKRLFNLKEAAVYLGRWEWGVRRLIWSGK